MSGAAPETLEKLLALQERWEHNQAQKTFDDAIAAARAEIPPIKKNRTVSFGAGKTAYNHEDLAEIERTILPILSKHGIGYRFRTTVVDTKNIIVTCVLFKSGYREENSLPGLADTSGSKNPIQALGSAVTYLERYTLKAALGLSATDDDDAVSVSNGNGEFITDAQLTEIELLLDRDEERIARFCAVQKIDALSDMPASRYEAAIAVIKVVNAKRKAKPAKGEPS